MVSLSLVRTWVLSVFLLSFYTVECAPLVEPLLLRSDSSNWSVNLTVQVFHFTSDQLNFTTRAYCYNSVCSIPGPTISVKPGDTVTITLTNLLGPNPNTTNIRNTLHTPNTTNIHTHGLHVDPNVDSVFRLCGPGETLVYNLVIPVTHAPGIHWYHTHAHGSSALLVMGGMLGMIIVEPSVSFPTLAINKTVMVFSNHKFNQNTVNGAISQGCSNGGGCSVFQGCALGTTNSPFNPFRAYSYIELSNEMGNQLMPNQTFADSTKQDVYMTNGMWAPTVSLGIGETRLLRLLHAGGAYPLGMQLPNQCVWSTIAVDGVYNSTVQPRVDLAMAQATRWEIQVQCSVSGSFPVVAMFGQDDQKAQQTLFTLVVSGNPPTGASTTLVTTSDLAKISAVKPDYLQDLTNAVVQSKYQVHFSQGGRNNDVCNFWLGGGSNCTDIWTGAAQPSSTSTTCQFESWSGSRGGNGYGSMLPPGGLSSYKFVTPVGAVNEWTIYGLGKDTHPFHLHVNHVQIMSFTPTPGGESDSSDQWKYYQVGEWHDTLPAFNGKLVVRFIANMFPGETVFHCHVLRHEDLGMMESIYICDPNSGGCGSNSTSSSSTGSASSNMGASSSAAATSTASGNVALSSTGTNNNNPSGGANPTAPPPPSGGPSGGGGNTAGTPPPPPGTGVNTANVNSNTNSNANAVSSSATTTNNAVSSSATTNSNVVSSSATTNSNVMSSTGTNTNPTPTAGPATNSNTNPPVSASTGSNNPVTPSAGPATNNNTNPPVAASTGTNTNKNTMSSTGSNSNMVTASAATGTRASASSTGSSSYTGVPTATAANTAVSFTMTFANVPTALSAAPSAFLTALKAAIASDAVIDPSRVTLSVVNTASSELVVQADAGALTVKVAIAPSTTGATPSQIASNIIGTTQSIQAGTSTSGYLAAFVKANSLTVSSVSTPTTVPSSSAVSLREMMHGAWVKMFVILSMVNFIVYKIQA